MSTQPKTWDGALVAAGFVNPRNGDPSFNQLARAAGMPTSTVIDVSTGRTKPRPSTIKKIADALGLDVRVVSEWVGQKRTERGPYQPPAEADLLTDRQRKAVDEIIRAIVAERAGGHGRDEQPAIGERAAAGGRGVARDAERDGVTAGEEAGEEAPPFTRGDFDLAAKHGRNRGSEAREQQDRHAEHGGA